MKTPLNAGIHADVPMADYIADPAPAPSLSTGTACALLDECPRAAWARHPRLNPERAQESSSASDLGSLAHDLVLMNDRSRVVVVQAPDWRTKDAKAQREAAQAEGKIAILADRWPKLQAMVAVAQGALARLGHELKSEKWMVEQTMVWQDGDGGPWCRSRPDILLDSFDYAIDYKTTATSAAPGAVTKLLTNQGYDVQAGFIRAGTFALTGKTPDVIFMVQEVEPPFLVSFVGLAPMFAAIADKKVERATAMWRVCTMSGKWPGYPDRVAWVEPPAWELAKFEAMT